MSPQVIAAIIAAGVGLLTVGRADFGGRRTTSRDTQNAARSARVSIWIGRSRSSAPPGGRPALNERFATGGTGQLGDDKPSAVGAGRGYAVASLAEALKLTLLLR